MNGKIIGEQHIDLNKSITATFEVPWVAGQLTARCYDRTSETASETIRTTGKAQSIRLIADHNTITADRNDLSNVMAEIIDSEGNVVPDANTSMLNFVVSGNGEIAGVGNGRPTEVTSFQQPHKATWQGRCLAIVRPKGNAGTISLKATSEGLMEASVLINVK